MPPTPPPVTIERCVDEPVLPDIARNLQGKFPRELRPPNTHLKQVASPSSASGPSSRPTSIMLCEKGEFEDDDRDDSPAGRLVAMTPRQTGQTCAGRLCSG